MGTSDEEFERDLQRDKELRDMEVEDWPDEDLMRKLRESYERPKIPPCHICGAELSLHGFGSGPSVYYCDGKNEDGTYKDGRKPIDQYFSQSRYEQYRHGDSRVFELMRRYQALKQKIESGAQEFPPGPHSTNPTLPHQHQLPPLPWVRGGLPLIS